MADDRLYGEDIFVYDEDTEVKTSDAVVPVIPASSLSPEALELQLLLAQHIDHPAVETTGGIIDLSA